MQNYAIVIFYSEEEKSWIGTVPDLEGCTVHSATPEEAFKKIMIAKESWLEIAAESQYKIPEARYKYNPAIVTPKDGFGENKLLKNRYLMSKKREETVFGAVFLATDLYSNRQVLVQILADYFNRDENFVARFERTAKSIAAAIHPNILGVLDYGQVEDTVYVVIPFVEGESLKDKLKREKKLSLSQINRYLQQAATAIDFANARNIIHTGLAPNDMLLQTEDDWLGIVFDIEQVFRGSEIHTRGSGVLGFASYMAPEQFSGRMEAASHIYTLGCILFEMLTGEPPYTGPVEDLLVGHKVGPIPSIVEHSQGQLPETLQAVMDKALAKEPKARFQAAEELAAAFQESIAHLIS